MMGKSKMEIFEYDFCKVNTYSLVLFFAVFVLLFIYVSVAIVFAHNLKFFVILSSIENENKSARKAPRKGTAGTLKKI